MTRPLPKLLRASWRSWLMTDGVREGPGWLQPVWTLLFCIGVASGFTLLGFLFQGGGRGAWLNPGARWHWFQINLVISLVIGFLIHALFELGQRALGEQRVRALQGPWRAVYFAGLPIVGVLIGWPVGVWLVSGQSGIRFTSGNMRILLAMLLFSVVISFLIYLWFEGKSRSIQAERRATEARLKLLQAQIEPHFLFNTLANVVSLIDHDAPRAKRMLETFTDYLRASLGELRHEHSTVGAELDMATHYLELLQMRMDERLRFRISASEAARGVTLPPLLLQPLVENAVLHGLEPRIDGGQVLVSAVLDPGRLRLQVEDDGQGPGAATPARSGGLALDNIRERLRSRYGDAASLQIEALSPGTRITISLPAA